MKSGFNETSFVSNNIKQTNQRNITTIPNFMNDTSQSRIEEEEISRRFQMIGKDQSMIHKSVINDQDTTPYKQLKFIQDTETENNPCESFYSNPNL